jgi:uncharacterized protein (DUF1697 family)
MATVLAANPFKSAAANQVAAIFLDAAPPRDTLELAIGGQREEIAIGKRELYVHYPDGMGRSKLKIPAAKHGTARNMNTLAKLVEMVST